MRPPLRCCWTDAHRLSPRHLDLERESSSSRRARLFVVCACADWQLDLIRDGAGFRCGTGHAGLATAVYDDHGRPRPGPLRSAGPAAESQRGHGLFIVAALVCTGGSAGARDEKCVWALLSVSAWGTLLAHRAHCRPGRHAHRAGLRRETPRTRGPTVRHLVRGAGRTARPRVPPGPLRRTGGRAGRGEPSLSSYSVRQLSVARPAGVPSTHRSGSPARGDGGRRWLAETSPDGVPGTRRQGWRR